ncbi:MAG: DUF2807 domain-containing protein [Bacteroidales bacterium]|nr:DUF2807 domain-containing protein [Bacteroidales bacterium]
MKNRGIIVMIVAVVMLLLVAPLKASKKSLCVPKSERRQVSFAHHLKIDGPFTVEMTGAVEPGVVFIEGDSLFLPFVETEVYDNTLHIKVADNKPKKVQQMIPVKIRINFDWLSMNLSSGVSATCDDMLQVGDMQIELTKGSVLTTNLMCATLKINCSSNSSFSGHLETDFLDLSIEDRSSFVSSGQCQKLLLYCSNYSSFSAPKFICIHAYVQTYSYSYVDINCVEHLEVAANNGAVVNSYNSYAGLTLTGETLPESVRFVKE